MRFNPIDATLNYYTFWTPRRKQIAELLAQHKTQREIAAALGVTKSCISNTVERMREQLAQAQKAGTVK